MAKIQTIKNKDNKTIYPQTHTQAVYDANGKKLQEWMNTYVTIANTSVADNTISLKKLKDINNNTIYPRTRTDAVIDDQGNNLDTIHAQFIKSDKIENVDDATILYEQAQNKTTFINSESTDVQYPSAKAVYDALLEIKRIGIKMEKVSERPEQGESNVIYLVPNTENENENTYDEWMYIENQGWEKIGTTEVDLTNYATETFVNTTVENARYQERMFLTENYTKTSELNSVALSGNYNDLNGTPTIPSSTSDLTNDSNFRPITYSTTDLTAGTSALTTGSIYLVYE